METTPVIENFLNQCTQHASVVSVSVDDASQVHMGQIKRLNLIVFHFLITIDSKDTEIDFVVPIESVDENSYEQFAMSLDDLLICNCLVQDTSSHTDLKLDIQQTAMNNRGTLTYYIRPPDGYRQLIYSEYADEIVPTDTVFLELIEKIKSTEHVLDVKVEKLLNSSVLTEEEKKVTHVFFRIKHTIPGTSDFRYGHLIMSEPSCCNVLEQSTAITQVQTMIAATPND
jgi:hypothetical protein